MSITLKELASRAGVSVTAASLVLNHKGGGHVGSEKASEIMSLAQELGYRPNLSARSLRGGVRKLIGVVMNMPRDSSAILFSGLLQRHLGDRGYMSLFSFWRGYEEVASCYRAVLEHQVDGIIAWENPQPELAGVTPQVVYYAAEGQPYDAVVVDNRAMVREAVDRFLAAGRVRLGVMDSRTNACHAEMSGYARELELAPPVYWDCTAAGFVEQLYAADWPQEHFPDGLFVHNDVLAEVVARYVRGRGWRIPDDVMIIGCNNMAEIVPEAPLPTFDIHQEQIVDTLIRLLFRRMASAEAPLVREMVRPTFVPCLHKAIYQQNRCGGSLPCTEELRSR